MPAARQPRPGERARKPRTRRRHPGYQHACHRESSCTKIIYGDRDQLTALFAESGQNLALTCLGANPEHPLAPAYIIWQLCSALALARDHGNDHARAAIYLNLGAAYRAKCPVTYGQSSSRWVQKALELFRELCDRESEARALISISLAYANAGNIPAARQHADLARGIFSELGNAILSVAARELLVGIPHMQVPGECNERSRESESFRSWLEDLPHAVLRGNDDRLQEFRAVTSVRWSQVTPQINQ